MRKKFFLILTMIFLISFSGCSNSKKATKGDTAQVIPPVVVKEVKPVVTAKVPDFDKNTIMMKPGKSVPVLMYHSISYEKDNPIRLTAQKFEQQLKYLKDNGYYTITLKNLYEYFMTDTKIPEKSVVLTFDDGYEDNYKVMFPLLKKYNFKATIFVITSDIDKYPTSMTSKQLLEMEEYGVDIESHTANHENLKELSKDKQLATLTKSKKDLEKKLNKKVNFFAFPYGGYNDNAIAAVKEAGYTMAFSTDGRWSSKSDGILQLHRVYISSLHDMEEFKNRVTNPNPN